MSEQKSRSSSTPIIGLQPKGQQQEPQTRVQPSRCQSECVEGKAGYHRCKYSEGHIGTHRCGIANCDKPWTDAEAKA